MQRLGKTRQQLPAGENDRRAFLRRAALAAGGTVVTSATVGALTAHTAWATNGQHLGHDGSRRLARRSDYGELAPARDQDGAAILALPRGFEYVTFSRTGDPLAGGGVVPALHDGMACFDGPGNTIRLIRNHELRNPAGNFTLGVTVPAALRYDPKAAGGCLTVDFDPKRKRVVREFASVGGTIVNCAGGWSWRNTGWLTCEETTTGIKSAYDKPHGYCYLVPAWSNVAVPAVPLKAMGRFSHEAALADERGIVYQTEDAGNTSGFYRFVPNRREDLAAGGRLQMLAVKGAPTAALYAGQTVGAKLAVEWVDVEVPDPDLEGGGQSCFAQGRAKGGAAFNRLEGLFRGLDGRSIYFVSTSGGEAGYGQLWHYLPAAKHYDDEDRLVLVFQSPKGSVLDSPDNICVSPSGAILFCEDDANPPTGDDHDTHPLAPGIANVNRLVGLGLAGEPFEFAVNIFSDSEFAGACFSPDGEILFVNIQGGTTAGTGMTCAIWGPWERGPL